MSYTPKQRTFKKRESKEEFAARKKAEKEQAYEIIDNSITDIMQDDEGVSSFSVPYGKVHRIKHITDYGTMP